jgi:predicted DCC family thiol-disulfide oxidoreductase YuxK
LKNGWTGGQYSLFRAIFGSYLFVHFVALVPWGQELFSNVGLLPVAGASPLAFLFPNLLSVSSPPGLVAAMLVCGALLSVLFAVGIHDRWAAAGLWYIWACLLGRNPLILNPGLPFVGWMLLAHIFVPTAPYGSWAARGRPDPAGSWRMPDALFAVAWIVMAVGYSYSGITKISSPSWLDGSAFARVLENPLARPGPLRDGLLALPPALLRLATWSVLGLEVAFAPLALLRRLRPIVWATMLLLHLSLLILVDFADLSLSMVILHLFTLDPAWIPSWKAELRESLFYDGGCGLCHRAVRFLLAEDVGQRFRFAPLGGPTFLSLVSEADRARLPDSLVVRTEEGRLLTRSAAVVHLLKRLGGLWRVIGTLGGCVPRSWLDWAYDVIARVRHRLFAKPDDACPVVPRELRARFDP